MRDLDFAGGIYDGTVRLPRRGSAALAWSIGAHLLLVYAATWVSWAVIEAPPRSVTEFVWLGERRPAERVAPPALEPLPPPRAAEAEARSEPPAPSPPVTEPSPRPAPLAPPQPAVISPETLTAPRGVAPAGPASDTPAEPRPVRATDWDEERRRAIADVLEQQARDANFSTFSLDDIIEPRPPPKPERRSIFDTPTSKRSVARAGQPRTQLGRRLASFCNALTGGFGFFGTSFCAADSGPSGLFPELKPEYLKMLPECVETRPLGPLLAEPSPFPTIKCRLVKKDEE